MDPKFEKRATKKLPSKKIYSLNDFVYLYTDCQLDKDRLNRPGSWEDEPLSKEQQECK